MAEPGGLFEISIGLAPGQTELAREALRRLGQLRMALEQTQRGIELPRLVGLGRAGNLL